MDTAPGLLHSPLVVDTTYRPTLHSGQRLNLCQRKVITVHIRRLFYRSAGNDAYRPTTTLPIVISARTGVRDFSQKTTGTFDRNIAVRSSDNVTMFIIRMNKITDRTGINYWIKKRQLRFASRRIIFVANLSTIMDERSLEKKWQISIDFPIFRLQKQLDFNTVDEYCHGSLIFQTFQTCSSCFLLYISINLHARRWEINNNLQQILTWNFNWHPADKNPSVPNLNVKTLEVCRINNRQKKVPRVLLVFAPLGRESRRKKEKSFHFLTRSVSLFDADQLERATERTNRSLVYQTK